MTEAGGLRPELPEASGDAHLLPAVEDELFTGAGEAPPLVGGPPATVATLLSGPQLARLSALWFGLQFFYSTNQPIVLVDKVRTFVPVEHFGMYRFYLDTAGSLLALLTQLAIGFISDHTYAKLGRRRPFILSGTALGLVAVVLFMYAPGYWPLFVAYLLLQITLNSASVPFQSLLPDLVSPAQHSRAGALMGVLHVTGNIAGLLTIIVMSLVFGGDKRDTGLLVFLLPAYVLVLAGTALISSFGVRETSRDTAASAEPQRGFRLLGGGRVAWPARLGGLIPAILSAYAGLQLLSRPALFWLICSRFFFYLGFSTFVDWISPFAHKNLDVPAWLSQLGLSGDFDALATPLIMLFFLLGGVAGNLSSAPLAERYGKLSATAVGLGLATAVIVPFIFTRDVWVAIGLGLLVGLGYGSFLAADWALACSLMPADKAGLYMGVWTVSGLIPMAIGPAVYGPLRDGVFNAQVATLGERAAEALAHQWIFVVVALYMALSLVLLIQVRRHLRDSEIQMPNTK